MATTKILDDGDLLMKALMAEVKLQVERIAEEEIAKAQAAVQDRVKEVMPNMAMKIMSQYEMMTDGRVITIRVSKSL